MQTSTWRAAEFRMHDDEGRVIAFVAITPDKRWMWYCTTTLSGGYENDVQSAMTAATEAVKEIATNADP